VHETRPYEEASQWFGFDPNLKETVVWLLFATTEKNQQ
jgi:hypothetical protein